jgi:hypothetical protein
MLGNWEKTFHPRNVEVAEFVNIVMNVPHWEIGQKPFTLETSKLPNS